MANLPRLNRFFSAVSRDLGSYSWLNCNTSSGFSCSLPPLTISNALVGSEDASSPINYAEGLLSFTIVGVGLLAAALLALLVFLCGRYCLCCITIDSCCACARCGFSEPTPASGKCCKRDCAPLGCYCGALRQEVSRGCNGSKSGTGAAAQAAAAEAAAGGVESLPVSSLSSDQSDHEWRYSLQEKVTSRVCGLLFVAALVGVICAGSLGGLLALPQASSGIPAQFTQTLAPRAEAMIGHGQALVANVAADVLGPQALALRGLLNTSFDLCAVAGAAAGVQGLLQSLNVAPVFTAVLALNVSMAGLGGQVIQPLLGSLSSLGTQRLAIAGLFSDLDGMLGQAVAWQTRSSVLNASLQANLSAVEAQQDMLGSSGSLLSGLSADVSALGSSSPSSTSLRNATGPEPFTDTSVTATLNRLLQGSMNGVSAEQLGLRGKLLGINSTLSGLLAVNFSRTATGFGQINSSIAVLRISLLPSLNSSLGEFNGLLGNLSSIINSLTGSVQAAFDTADNLTGLLGSMSSSLDIAEQLLEATQGNLSALLGSLDILDGIFGVLPYAQVVLGEVHRLNASLVRLPFSIEQYLAYAENLNGTLTDLLQPVDGIRDTIALAQTQLADFNASQYSEQIQGAQVQLQANMGQLNISSLLGLLSGLDIPSLQANISSAQSSLTTGLEQLQSTNTSQLDGDLLQKLEGKKGSLIANITAAVRDLAQLAQGYCSNDASLLCSTASVASDCSSGAATCLGEGSYRCRNAGNSACQQDSDCPAAPGSAYCLADLGRAGTVRSGLVGLLDLAAFDTAGVTSSLQQLGRDVDTLGEGLTGFSPAELSSGDSFSGNTIASLRSSLTSANASLFAVSLAEAQSALLDANAQLSSTGSQADVALQQNASIEDYRGTALRYVGSGRSLLDFGCTLFSSGIPAYAQRISHAQLAAAVQAGGASGLVATLLTIAQEVYDDARGAAEELLVLPLVNISAVVPYDLIDRITSRSPSGPRLRDGIINFALYWAAPQSSFVFYPLQPGGSSVMRPASSSGGSYAPGAMCVQDGCLAATVQQYSSLSMKGLLENELRVRLPSAIPEQLISMPPINMISALIWSWPAAIAVMTSLAMMTPWCCACRRPQCQKCPAACAAGCSCCMLPCAFLLGGLLVPLGLLLSDICATGPSIAGPVIASVGPGLCTMVGGSMAAGSSLCNLQASIPLPSSAMLQLPIQLDILRSYRAAVSKECPGGPAPWQPALDTVVQAVRQTPFLEFQRLMPENGILSLGGSNSLALQPATIQFLAQSVNVTAEVLGSWLAAASGDLLSCSSISTIARSPLDATCTQLQGPLVAFFFSFYIIAFLLCCLGIPANLTGRKRWPSKLWGPLAPETQDGCCCGFCPPCCGCCQRKLPPVMIVDEPVRGSSIAAGARAGKAIELVPPSPARRGTCLMGSAAAAASSGAAVGGRATVNVVKRSMSGRVVLRNEIQSPPSLGMPESDARAGKDRQAASYAPTTAGPSLSAASAALAASTPAFSGPATYAPLYTNISSHQGSSAAALALPAGPFAAMQQQQLATAAGVPMAVTYRVPISESPGQYPPLRSLGIGASPMAQQQQLLMSPSAPPHAMAFELPHFSGFGGFQQQQKEYHSSQDPQGMKT